MASYTQRFTVVGKGAFPLDMLRYDYCYPCTSDDAVVIGAEDWNGKGEPRTVELSRTIAHSKVTPTEGRWASFGWRLVPGSVRNIKQ